jgi:hypothetical protein
MEIIFLLRRICHELRSPLKHNGQAVCVVAASSGVACFLKAGKNDNLVINRAII